ncbi:mechanosensitive ion channel family protein [Microbacter margulisiae]|nr:mechanosensitive ion channel domain-containing protein [Microbacter margulisiae]
MLAVDTLTMSDYMMSMDRVNDKLNDIADSARLGFEVERMDHMLDLIANNITLIRLNMGRRRSGTNIKNLYLYQSFASNFNAQNDRIEARLDKMYNTVYRAKLRLKTVMSDSIFRILCADSSLRHTFSQKLIRLEQKWSRVDSLTATGVNTLNGLKVKVTNNAITLSDMLNFMNYRLDKAGQQLFAKETNFFWQKSLPDTLATTKSKSIVNIFESEQKAVNYYISQTSRQQGLIVTILILLFVWLFQKRKQLKAFRKNDEKFAFLHLRYLNTHPVLSLFIVVLSIMPFFDAYAPTSYISGESLILLGVVSTIMFAKWDRSKWFVWLILVGLFIAVASSDLFFAPAFPQRLLLLLLHIAIVIAGLRFLRKMAKETVYYRLSKFAIIVGIVLAFLAMVNNIFGRFSLSQIFGTAAIFAITQAITLPIFLEIVIEIFLLQFQSARLKKGNVKPFETTILVNKIRLPLLIILSILWVIMLASNLDIYHYVYSTIHDFLTNPRVIGSISFKWASVLLFFVIIWMAHILQRLITFLFGETGYDLDDITTATKGQHSRLLVTRLLVLIGGYLLAIAASGLPIDKLTIIIGALGVGVGMGLQSIVNNFVSGIILIFDGSLKIGDEIEVNGQAGKVKEIGLRVVTINTADGAEVMIPNGTILSQNIVNWTYSNDQRRVVLDFSLSGNELDTNVINDVINDVVSKLPNVIAKNKPVILFTKVHQDTCWLTIRFWSTITNVEQVKSAAMLQLNAAFKDKNIKME